MSDFAETKLFGALKVVRPDTWEKVAELIAAGEDVHQTGTYREGYLHVLAAPRPEGQHVYVLPVIYQLSAAGIDFNNPDREGNTPLHICSLNDAHPSIVLAMIRCGADPCLLNREEQDALDLCGVEGARGVLEQMDPGLWRAVGEGDLDKTTLLLKRWCKVSITRDSKKLISFAGEGNNPEVKEVLKKNKEQCRFVHASLSGSVDTVKEMLQKDVDVNAVDPYRIRGDGTQISWPLFAEVIESNLLPVAKVLVKKVDPNVMIDVNYGNPQPLFMWAIDATKELLPENILKPLFKKADLSKVPRVCDILYKLWNRNVSQELIDILFPDGIPVAARDQNGYTLRELIFLENIDDEEKRKENLYFVDRVILNWAKEGRKEKLEDLVYKGYEYINVSNKKGKSISDLAKKQEQKAIVKYLKNIPGIQGDLHDMMVAIGSANLQRTKEILDGKSIAYKDRGYRSPLHIAVLFERKYCVKYILQNFPESIDFTDLFGRTALHYASTMTGGEEFRRALIKAGSDNSLKDVYGYTPEDYIAQAGYNFLEEERLKEYGRETYLMQKYFVLKSAIKNSDLDLVKETSESLKITKSTLNDIHTKVEPSFIQAKYRPLLFICLDNDEIDIAKYLIKEGSSVRVYAPIKDNCETYGEKEMVSFYDAAVSHRLQRDFIDMIKLKEYQRQLEQEREEEQYKEKSYSPAYRRPSDSGRSTSLSAYMQTDINGNGKQNWNKVKHVGNFVVGAGEGVKNPEHTSAQSGSSGQRSSSSACVIV